MKTDVEVEGMKRLNVVRSIRKAKGQKWDDEDPGLSYHFIYTGRRGPVGIMRIVTDQ